MRPALGTAAAGLALILLPVPAAGAAAKPKPPRPALVSLTASPTRLGASGGVVKLTVRTNHATTCVFSGQLRRRVPCAKSSVKVVDRVGANPLTGARVLRVKVVAHGRGGSTVANSVVITEAGKPRAVATTTTAVRPGTTTTTSVTVTSVTGTPVTSTSTTASSTTTTGTSGGTCSGPCRFTFPQPDAEGFASVALNSVAQDVTCPDAGSCTNGAGQQVDDVNVTMCAGPSGVFEAGAGSGSFALALSDGSQGAADTVSYDSNVATAFGNYGAVAPGQCVTGDIYFDAATGTQWTSLNYAYTSADYSTEAVYAWQA